MRAVVMRGTGGTDVLAIEERPAPEAGGNRIRVRVHAAGLNRADIQQRLGRYPVPPGWPEDIPGLEYAGEVESAGEAVTRWAVGDRVMGLVGGGACAEFVVVHEDEALPVPAALSLSEAAAIPESFLTAFDALMVRARLVPGERVLVHAVGSGLGTAAVQVGRVFGASVIGTSRTPSKLEAARELGLGIGIDSGDGTFADAVGDPVDVILDVIGASAWAENLRVLAPLGRLVLLGFLGGSRGPLDLLPVLRKRIEVIGTVMRARSLAERVALADRARHELLPHFESGALRPVIAGSYPMEEMATAHARMEAGALFGKLVLAWYTDRSTD